MRGNNKYLTGAFLSAALLYSRLTDAMPIHQFDKMSESNQANYMAWLLKGTESQFHIEGKQVDLLNLMTVFRHSSGPALAPGFTEFKNNLDAARESNRADANNPYRKPLDVEQTFALTLKQNGILVSEKELLAAGRNFKPSKTTHAGGLKGTLSNTNTNL
jgi:hypothetical protein